MSDARRLGTLPEGTVLSLDGRPAVIRRREGWRYVSGRYLGCNEVEDLDFYPYTVATVPVTDLHTLPEYNP